MRALRDASAEMGLLGNAEASAGACGDGSWVLGLLQRHSDPRFRRTAAVVAGRDIKPLPFRLEDAGGGSEDPGSAERFADDMERIIDSVAKGPRRASDAVAVAGSTEVDIGETVEEGHRQSAKARGTAKMLAKMMRKKQETAEPAPTAVKLSPSRAQPMRKKLKKSVKKQK